MRNRTSEALAKSWRNEGEKIEKVVKGDDHRWTRISTDVLGQRHSPEGWLPVLLDPLQIRVDLCSSAVQLSFEIGQIVRNQKNQVVTC